jgi:hypothetical protein
LGRARFDDRSAIKPEEEAMPLTRSSKLAASLSLAVLAALAPAGAQPDRRGDDGRVITVTFPQFVVHAVGFRAVDETGWDWAGSDEVHWVFADWNPFDERATTVYGDIDTGDTRTFRSIDRCIAPLPDCSRGVSRVHFAVAAWEKDPDVGLAGLFGLKKPRRANSHDFYETGISSGDDLIGRAEVGFSQQTLLGTLPNVGDVVEREIHPTGGSGSYRFTYRITRLPDVRKEIVIGPTRPERIVLQAALDPPPPGRINLTWTGASGASVDLLRGAALIATTPNDGQEYDRVQGGTYEYRVCNAGTTVCSNTVVVTVP